MKNSPTYPNLIVCGAPKCGTSSLYFWLAAHPEVGASRAKETFFFADEVNRFNKGCNYLEHGLEAYATLFAHCADKPVRFEATAPYIYYETAIKGISELPETPKLVFILREPGARLLSQYLFEKYRTGRFGGDFGEYIQTPGILDHGYYFRYLQKWIAAFGAGSIRVIQFEALMAHPAKYMKQLATWLRIDPTFYDDHDYTVRNETLAIKNKRIHQLGLKLQAYVPHWVQRLLLPAYLKVNAGGKPTAQASEKVLLEKVREMYREDNLRLLEAFPDFQPELWK